MHTPLHTVTLALSGASGMAYGLRLLECLLAADVRVYLLVSQAAHIVAKQELGIALPARAGDLEKQLAASLNARDGQLRVFGREDWNAPVASGSFRTAGMIVVPCSMRSLAAMAHGLGDNLLTRAADVTLKERRPLVLMVRETPLHLGHLRNMCAVTEMGGVIMPPLPAFYHRPTTVDEIVDHLAARAIDQLHLPIDSRLREWNPDLP